ncbi:hypothetical protein V8E54_008268 [Elaphomyces granulatus]
MPPETPPRVQGVATAINGLSALRDKYGTLLSSPSRHVLEQSSIHLNKSLVMDRTLEAYEKSATERLNRRKSRRQVKTLTGHIELSQIGEKIEARDAEERRKLMRQQEVMWHASPKGMCEAVAKHLQEANAAVDIMRIDAVLHNSRTGRQGILDRTARRWLTRLGWIFGRNKKGFCGGHEQLDVIDYREKVFCPRMKVSYIA